MAEDKKPDGSQPPADDKVSKAEVEKQIGELRSIKDKEIAERDRRNADLTEQLETLKKGADGDTSAAQAKLAEAIARLREVETKETGLKEKERQLTAKELATKYSVPAEELLKIPDVKDMTIKALELQAEELKKQKPAQTGNPRPPMERSSITSPAQMPRGNFDSLRDAMDKHVKTQKGK